MAANKIQATSLVVAACFCLSQALCAYELPLDVHSLHEAWQLGQQNDPATAAFLARYLKKISGGESDPYTAEIEILTPYAQVVDQSRQKTTAYSEEQAALDYRQRGDIVLVNVVIMLPAAYPTTGANSRSENPPPQKTAGYCVQKISGKIFSSMRNNMERQFHRARSASNPLSPPLQRALPPV